MFRKFRTPARALRVAAVLAVAAVGGVLSSSSAFADALPPGLAGEQFETYSSTDVTFQVTSRTCNRS